VKESLEKRSSKKGASAADSFINPLKETSAASVPLRFKGFGFPTVSALIADCRLLHT
jgi:hypothetical protein